MAVRAREARGAHAGWHGRPRAAARAALVSAALAALAGPRAARAEVPLSEPTLQVRTILTLEGEPANENLATKNQAMHVWSTNSSEKELLVGLIHRYGNLDRRADDRQFAVAWESDGQTMREVKRIPMTCPDVELVVPNRGPFVYEARLDYSPWSLHPECSCPRGSVCPAGVEVTDASANKTSLESPINSHFVSLQNEWEELIADPAVLGRLIIEVNAPVAAAGTRPANASSTATPDGDLACPASRDEPLGSHTATSKQLEAAGIRLAGNVSGSWCLVRRGVCDETPKVKLCEAAGAVGTIIVDHGFSAAASDQEIVVRYIRKENETATKPVLFLSKAEGDVLFARVAAGEQVNVTVGPRTGGPTLAQITPGSGLIVHAMGAPAAGALATKAYPDLFGTAGWLEVSRLRDIMFVCFPALQEIRLYNVSAPMEDIGLLSRIQTRCSGSSFHDYRILEFKDLRGRFNTILVDPNDFGNRLLYYDTEDPRNPKPLFQLHANWEADNDGLGQVRPGGPAGRYLFVTWHCSNLYCDKNHGDAVYVLDTWNPQAAPIKVVLPMLTQGGFARDVTCGEGSDAVCLVTLTWDGVVAIDPGSSGRSVNKFRIVASTSSGVYRDDGIPQGRLYLKIHSGAQKVYASRAFSRTFYVEHSDFSYRPLRLGDSLRALQLRQVHIVRLLGYDEATPLPALSSEVGTDPVAEHDHDGHTRGGKGRRGRRGDLAPGLLVALIFSVSCASVAIIGCGVLLLRRRRRGAVTTMAAPGEAPPQVDGRNVVVGRPVEAAAGEAVGATQGQACAPSVVGVAGMKPRRETFTPKDNTE